jgi:hypothetical protein
MHERRGDATEHAERPADETNGGIQEIPVHDERIRSMTEFAKRMDRWIFTWAREARQNKEEGK